MKTITRFTAAALAAPLFFLGFAHAGGDPWRELAGEMMGAHEGLRAKNILIESLEQIPEARMAWDDPMINIGLMSVPVDSFDFTQEGMTQKVVGISQRIPSLAMRMADRDFALKNVGMARAKERLYATALAEELKRSVYEIAYTGRALEILSNNERIIEEFISISSAKYATGKGVQADVIQAQVEKSRLLDRRLALEERKKLALIRLNRLLGRESGSPFDPAYLPLDSFTGADIPSLWEEAKINSTEIRLATANKDLAGSELAKAEAMTGMNVTLSMQYGQRDDTPMERADFVSANASVSLPLWRRTKQDRLIAGANLKVSEAAMSAEDVIKEVKSALERAAASYAKEEETIRLYEKGIIPQARQALLASQAAYQLDKADFLSMLTNELTVLRYELEAEMALLRKRQLSARIEALTGRLAPSGDQND